MRQVGADVEDLHWRGQCRDLDRPPQRDGGIAPGDRQGMDAMGDWLAGIDEIAEE